MKEISVDLIRIAAQVAEVTQREVVHPEREVPLGE